VTELQFLGTVRDAAVDAGRTVRVLAARGAGADHPTLPAFPEGRYLSALLLGVD
jgi:23S rRNA (cytosine1962-C5)-methyltransferase